MINIFINELEEKNKNANKIYVENNYSIMIIRVIKVFFFFIHTQSNVA